MTLIDILMLLYVFPVSGILACGLFVGDTIREFEKKHNDYGAITAKDAIIIFKAMFRSALVTKAILGAYTFPAAVIYKLIMKEDFDFRFFLPKDFWTKYFTEDDKQP